MLAVRRSFFGKKKLESNELLLALPDMTFLCTSLGSVKQAIPSQKPKAPNQI